MTLVIPTVPALIAAALLAVPCDAEAQTRSARDTATAYGARANGALRSATLNANRVNNRVNNRISTRLNTRLERSRPDAVADPVAAVRTTRPDDGSRAAPILPDVGDE